MSLIFEPSRVHAVVRSHERRVRERRPAWQMLQAAYLTRFWEHVGLMSDASRWGKWNVNGTEIEVNRLWRGVMTYKSSLYRRSNRVELGPDPVGSRGDPVVSAAVANALWKDDRLATRLDRLVGMSLLFPGAGFKAGVDEGRGPPLRRAWTRAVPWWELVLDADVTDEEDERYRGHRYWMPVEEAEAKYGCVGLKGKSRVDFLSDSRGAADRDGEAAGEDREGDGEWVEVLEWVNFRDGIRGRGNALYKGRFEVYVLGQAGSEYKGPVREGPLPFADADGVGLSPVEALIFEHEPPYPLRGVAPAERVLPQLREYNVLRTKLAELVRRNARKGLKRKGALADDQVDKLFDGNDGQMVDVDDPNMRLDDVIHMLPSQAIPAEVWNWLGMVDADYAGAWGQVAPARGEATEKGKTAYANQLEQFWTETEVGYHGNVLASFSRRVVKLLLRVVVHAMGTVESSSGTAAGVNLAPVGSVPGEAAAVVAGGEDVAGGEEVAGGPGEAVPAVEGAALALADGSAVEVEVVASPGAVTVTYAEWVVRDADGRQHVVTRDALDADFDIKFLEGARTPLADAAVTQFLATQSEVYFGWFGLVLKGGPMAVLARAWMGAVAERMQLPPELHVAALEARSRREVSPGADEVSPGVDVVPEPAVEASPGGPVPVEEVPAEGGEAVDALVFALRSVVDALAVLSGVDAEASAGAVKLVDVAIEAAGRGDVSAVVDAAGSAMEVLGAIAGKVQAGTAEDDALREAATVLGGVVRAGMPGGGEGAG
jgi:hypothetical protein